MPSRFAYRPDHDWSRDAVDKPSEGQRDRKLCLLYENPPAGMTGADDHLRGYSTGLNLTVVSTDINGQSTIRVTELGSSECDLYLQLPMALSLDRPLPTASIREALAEIAQETLASLPSQAAGAGAGLELPGPIVGLLTRRSPGLIGRSDLPSVVDGDFVAAITAAVEALDGSTLPVHGPPGTGKAYVGARVIARLVRCGWKIGVVSQGHSVINHFLDEVVEVGVSPDRVGKKGKPDGSGWTKVPPNQYQGFLGEPGGRALEARHGTSPMLVE